MASRSKLKAITIIRDIWNADQRGGVRVEGTYYQVVSAKRGPAPAHDVGIWLGPTNRACFG